MKEELTTNPFRARSSFQSLTANAYEFGPFLSSFFFRDVMFVEYIIFHSDMGQTLKELN